MLSKAEFIERAGGTYVLVDIDTPVTDRVKIPADRKKRYEELQTRYGINSFPTVVLALADGRAYVGPLTAKRSRRPRATGIILRRCGIAAAGCATRCRERSRSKASRGRPSWRTDSRRSTLGLFHVFTPTGWPSCVRSIQRTRPAILPFSTAAVSVLDEFQAPLDLHTGAILIRAAVDSLISRAKPRGQSLQEALVLRAAGEVLAKQDRRALASLKAAVDAQATRGRFDRGDYVLLEADSLAVVKRRLALAEADRGDGVVLYYSLHRIFQFDLPNPYEWSCGGAFQPMCAFERRSATGMGVCSSSRPSRSRVRLARRHWPRELMGRFLFNAQGGDPGDYCGDHSGPGRQAGGQGTLARGVLSLG